MRLTGLVVSAASLIASGSAFAANFGNVVVNAAANTSCSAVAPPLPKQGTYFPIEVTSFTTPSTSSTTTSYVLSIPSLVQGFTQPQYIVVRLDQVGKATSGNAFVFNNSFLGGVIGGTWSGTFNVDGFADFVINSVTYTASNGSCILTFSKGLAVLGGT